MKSRPLFSKNIRRYSVFSSLGLILLGVVLWGGFNTGMEATNTMPFCISCHEMHDNVYQEYRHSAHFSNPAGVQAGCPDCHVPREWVPKIIRKVQASVEVYHWLAGSIDTPEKFEAKRLQLAQRVWKTMQETDSRECRNCHAFTDMDFEGQARFAARIHRGAIEQGKTCIDCHKGLTHKLPTMAADGEQAVARAASKEEMDYGEEINETCAGCHGEYGEGTIDGEYPRLAGMNREYIVRQLRNFKERRRINIPMAPYANEREMPEEDVQAIASYLASIDLPTKLAPIEEANMDDFDAYSRLQDSKLVVNVALYEGNVAAGRRAYNRECAGCHGRDGYGDGKGVVPQLTGQYSIYLLRQIENFRKGERVHDAPEDAEIFQQFSKSEVDDILAYLSTLDDG